MKREVNSCPPMMRLSFVCMFRVSGVQFARKDAQDCLRLMCRARHDAWSEQSRHGGNVALSVAAEIEFFCEK